MKRLVYWCLSAVLLFTFTSCGGDKPLSDACMIFGEACVISLYDAQDTAVIDGAMAGLQRVATEWTEQLQKIDAANGEETAVDPDFLELLKTAQEYTLATDGAVDITVGALADVWETARERKVMPSESELSAAQMTVGGYRCRFGDGTVAVESRTKLTLDTIAAGALADHAADWLRSNHSTSAVVGVGDVTVMIGSKPNGDTFSYDIVDPATQNLVGTIAVKDRAVASVNTDEDRFEIDGEWYSPHIHPKTGYPVENDLVSVTVLASDATTAQVLANAFLMMDADKAWAMRTSFDGIDVVLLKTDGTVLASEGVIRID